MDMQLHEGVDMKFLYSKFGLCPDYKIIATGEEWVEYYVPTDSSMTSQLGKFPEPAVPYKEKIRLHLNTHYVEVETGVTLRANFAVSHENKIIFLQVTPMGELGRMMSTYK